MFTHDDSQDLSSEGFSEQVGSSRKNDLIQTLCTVPLLAASAGAVFLMLPSGGETTVQSDRFTSQATNYAIGFDGHDHKTRQQHVVLARMERAYQQDDLLTTD